MPFQLKAFQGLDTCDFSAFQMCWTILERLDFKDFKQKKFIIFVTLDIRILIFEYYFVLMYVIEVNNMVFFLF